MSNTPFNIRPMGVDDLETCLSFTQKVQWPHRMIDWQLHYMLGNGSVITDQNQQIVGTILWWDYGSQYATVGLVVVPEHMQGQGLGRTLMNTVMSQTGKRNLQLVATVAGKRLYEQCGFTEQGRIFQVQGTPHTKPSLVLASDTSIIPLTMSDLAEVVKLDKLAYQANRKDLLQALFNSGSALGLCVSGHLQGFGFVRQSGKGQTIGPIIANTETHAINLAAALLHQTDNFVRFDLSNHAPELKAWLIALGLVEVDNGCLMALGDYLPAKADKYFHYALASQAFG